MVSLYVAVTSNAKRSHHPLPSLPQCNSLQNFIKENYSLGGYYDSLKSRVYLRPWLFNSMGNFVRAWAIWGSGRQAVRGSFPQSHGTWERGSGWRETISKHGRFCTPDHWTISGQRAASNQFSAIANVLITYLKYKIVHLQVSSYNYLYCKKFTKIGQCDKLDQHFLLLVAPFPALL